MNHARRSRVQSFAERTLFFFLFSLLGVVSSLQAASVPAKIADLDSDNEATVFDLVTLINYVNGDASALPEIPGLSTAEKEELIDINQDGVVDGRDVDAMGDAILGINALPDFRLTRMAEASPANSEESVSPSRNVILRFSRRINPATINSDSFYLIANGARLPGRIEVSSTERFATFFPASPLPASTEIRIVVQTSNILDVFGRPVDPRIADGSSAIQIDFRTLPLFRIPGTAVSGYVYDSYRTNADGSNVPIIGATIRVDAFPEANAITDSRGYFTLTNVPAPEFFVHIDGSTAINAPPGTTYPSGGKLFHSVPGMSTQMPTAFSVYLPPMAVADVVALPPDRAVDVFFGPAGLAELARMFPTNDQAMFKKVCVTFPPGSAVDDAGRPATQAIIVPVPPDRLPSPLPSNLLPSW